MLPCLPACDGALKAFGPSGEGVEAVLACMESHLSNASVQATACWSMVNLALIAKQKKALVQKGGVLAIVRAMARHPQDSDVHFRAMFALINLVTPDVTVEKTIQPDTMKVRVHQPVGRSDRYVRYKRHGRCFVGEHFSCLCCVALSQLSAGSFCCFLTGCGRDRGVGHSSFLQHCGHREPGMPRSPQHRP